MAPDVGRIPVREMRSAAVIEAVFPKKSRLARIAAARSVADLPCSGSKPR